MIAKLGDVYCFYNRLIEKYSACQVIGFQEKFPCILLLDYMSDTIMKEEEISTIKPMYFDFYHFHSEEGLALRNVNPIVPNNFQYVGNITPILQANYNGVGKWFDGSDFYLQRKWEKIPLEKRLTFREMRKNPKTVKLGNWSIASNRGFFSDERLPIDEIKDISIFPVLTTLELNKWYDGLLEYLKTNPFIISLFLKNHNQKIIDLRETNIDILEIDLKGVEDLYLNEDTRALTLTNYDFKTCNIHINNKGKGMTLSLPKPVDILPSFTNIYKFSYRNINEVDMSLITKTYPNLYSLELNGQPGIIKNFKEVTKFKNLEEIVIGDLFGFDSIDIPSPQEMRKLNKFWMSSIPAESAKEIKKLYKKLVDEGLDLSIKSPRKAQWLAENLDNPFRSWDGQEHISATNAKKAATIYKNTRSKFLKLATEENILDEVLKTVEEYTMTFNKMNKRNNFIETIEREEIYNTLIELLEILPNDIDKKVIVNKFEEVREF